MLSLPDNWDFSIEGISGKCKESKDCIAKAINELIDARKNGYSAQLVFIIQADYGAYFIPNEKTHKEFADALKKAVENGVEVICFNCEVQEDRLNIKEKMEYKI